MGKGLKNNLNKMTNDLFEKMIETFEHPDRYLNKNNLGTQNRKNKKLNELNKKYPPLNISQEGRNNISNNSYNPSSLNSKRKSSITSMSYHPDAERRYNLIQLISRKKYGKNYHLLNTEKRAKIRHYVDDKYYTVWGERK